MIFFNKKSGDAFGIVEGYVREKVQGFVGMEALHAWNLYFIFSICFSRVVTCTAKSIKKLLIAIDIILRVLGTCFDFSLGLCMY